MRPQLTKSWTVQDFPNGGDRDRQVIGTVHMLSIGHSMQRIFFFLSELKCTESMFHLTRQVLQLKSTYLRIEFRIQKPHPDLAGKSTETDQQSLLQTRAFAIPTLKSLIHLLFTRFSLSLGHLELLQEIRNKKPFFFFK